MSSRLYKSVLLLLAAGLLVGSSQLQKSLNRDREALGLTRIEPLENAPPVLAFTTVALGGFRGLISNALWIRATELQDEDKFFEMAQLADWITKLEPHFVQVWLVQAWNMAYNISVKFKDPEDRWRWVQRGIELLRDDGLRFNPNETLIYRELAWFFQHKMGHNLDDAHMHYKQMWAEEMSVVFANQKPNVQELIDPQTDDAKERAALLRNKYKMDPRAMLEVDERYGPLEWRLPEAHAIYWAAEGLKAAEHNPGKVNKEELIQLRRAIYQSMQLSFHRGRLVGNPFDKSVEFGPNIDIVPKVSAAYEQAMEEDEPNRDHISRAHRNFLRDAIYFLYTHNRVKDATYWLRYICQKYPDKPMLDGKLDSMPCDITVDRYAVARVQEDVGETDRNRVQAMVEGFLINSYTSLIIGEEERAAGAKLMARQIHRTYERNTDGTGDRIRLPAFEETDRVVLGRLLDPDTGLPLDAANRLRTVLGLPAAAQSKPATNAPTAVR